MNLSHVFQPAIRRVALLGIVLLTAGSLPSIAAAQVAQKNEVVSLRDALKDMLQAEGAAKLKKLTINVSEAQAQPLLKEHGIEAAGTYTVYQGSTNEDAHVGSVIIVNEQGKEGPLQLLVALRPDGKVYDLGFTVFGEDKGKTALTWGYLKQYIGKTAADPLTIGRDIDGVSGATWTSTSVATAVKKGVLVYQKFILPAP